MVSLIEFVISVLYLGAESLHAWHSISTYLPSELIDNIQLIKSILFDRTISTIVIAYILIIFWRLKLEKKTSIKLDYRFRDNANLLDIKGANLDKITGEITYIFINGKINSWFCKVILSLLQCKFLLIFESPIDVNINFERQCSSMEKVDDKHRSLILASDINMSGLRKIELAFTKEELGVFEGRDQISMKVCIGPKMWPFRVLFKYINGILCENKIDIV